MQPAKKARFQRLVRWIAQVLSRHAVGADALVGTVLDAWCERAYPELPKSGLPRRPKLNFEPAVVEFVELLCSDGFLEASYWLSSAYAVLAGDAYRRKLAMFFTPPSLTSRLLDDLANAGVDFENQTFCDPACGGAAFLAPIAQRMRAALVARGATAHAVIEHVADHLYGTDTDAALCELSRHFLLMVLHEEIKLSGEVPNFRVAQADSLLELDALYGAFDVLVCNPPYRKMAADEVANYRNRFDDVIQGQPNLYALFTALCVKLLKTDGKCALVTPTSFLSGQYFSKLRTFLTTEAKVLGIGMVSERSGVFMDVEQETALTLLERRGQAVHPSAVASVAVVSNDGEYVNVGQCTLPNSGSAWPIPRTESDVSLLQIASQTSYRLADYGYAPRVGSFVWNRDKRPTYMSAVAAKRCKTESAVPLLWSSDIKSDGIVFFDGLTKFNDEPCFVSLGTKSHPSIVRRPSVILQRVTSNDQPRRLVAAAVPAQLFQEYLGFVGENHTVVLEQVSDAPALSPKQLARLLGCPVVDRYFRCISGATNVSVFELNQLALPDPAQLSRLLADGLAPEDAAREAFASGWTSTAIRAKQHKPVETWHRPTS